MFQGHGTMEKHDAVQSAREFAIDPIPIAPLYGESHQAQARA